jgi:uridine kinase
VDQLVRAVQSKRKSLPPSRCAIVGISGIDASGKGFIAERLAERLRADGLNVAVIGGDGWLHLPEQRYAQENAGEHFLVNGFRFEELFLHLILPLRARRTVWLKANHTEQTANHYRQKIYDLREVDVAILESVFLFQPAYESYFDLKIWLECRFETALARALARGQEGLPPAETIADFERIYFPAQRLHIERDDPKARADILFPNDSPSTLPR